MTRNRTLKKIYRSMGARVSVLALAGALVAPVFASVIDFEDTNPPNGQSSITSDGFVFDVNAQGWGTFNGIPGCCSNASTDGTTELMADGGSPATVAMTEAGSLLFSLDQLDAATFFGSSGDILVTGYLGGGGTVTQTLSVTNSYQTFAIDSSFAGLSSVVFTDTVSGSFGTTPGIGLDNIVVNSLTDTPEPSQAIPLSAVLLGVAYFARKRSTRRGSVSGAAVQS